MTWLARQKVAIALLMSLAGATAIGAALWSGLGWEFAAGWWGACLLAAGLSEVLSGGDGG